MLSDSYTQVPSKLQKQTTDTIEAQFPGGKVAWIKFLEKNLKGEIPIENNAPPGSYRAVISFIIKTDGSLYNIKLITDPGYKMGEEGLRLIRISGKWLPAKINGIPVESYKEQDFRFEVQEEG